MKRLKNISAFQKSCFLSTYCWALWLLIFWGLLSPRCFVIGEEIFPPILEAPITAEDRDHWAFRPLTKPRLPTVKNFSWVRNSIDFFVLARLEAASLVPLPSASRTTLMRRLSFDLTGLPPSPREIERFKLDSSPAAYEQLVDRLLASPAFGEHWAQRWLDLARFAETDGFEHDKVRSQAWRYRDWVIQALNHDLPYDEFIRRQIAGDELPSQDAIATAFCLSGPDMPDINSQKERRNNVLNELTGTIGSAILGLQLGCAQCHDHKYDPVSQADFYRLRAIFEPAVQVKSGKSLSIFKESHANPGPSYLLIRGDWRRQGPQVQPAFPRIANPWNEQVQPPGADSQSSGRRRAFAFWATRSDHPLTTRVIVNRLWQHLLGQGLSRTPSDFGIMGDEPSHPRLLDHLAWEFVQSGWSIKQLCKKIVTSATYRQASRPSEPSWSSQQREQAQTAWRKAVAEDPENRLLARANRRRLTGESIRDAMLAASGQLSFRQGGPGVRPPLAKELLITLLRDQWQESPDKEDHHRRSIYIFARRNLRYPMFEAFDRPDGNASCPLRDRSTTAPQSLLLFNSDFSLEMAKRLAGYVLAHSQPSVDQGITLCFTRCLGRRPSEQELAECRKYLARQVSLLQKEGRLPEDLALPVPLPGQSNIYAGAALTDLCLAIFNMSEFLYID